MKKKIDLNFPVGIIDVGSNSVRLLLTDGVFFNKNIITTRLGEGLTKNKELTANSIMRTVNAVKTLVDLAKSKGANQVFVFATAAVREAVNGKEFTSLVKDLTGITVDVVSGDNEAELGIKGALNGEIGGIIDVGGASTEVAYFDGVKTVYKKSLPMGAVKLYTQFGRDKEKISKFACQKAEEYGEGVMGSYKAIGGTATTLASIDLNLKVYDSSVVDGHFISLERLEKIADKLYSLTPTEIINNYAIQPQRADIIAGGASVICAVCKQLKLDGITVSEKDNLEGYLYFLQNEKEDI